jgi:hypothetical protein
MLVVRVKLLKLRIKKWFVNGAPQSELRGWRSGSRVDREWCRSPGSKVEGTAECRAAAQGGTGVGGGNGQQLGEAPRSGRCRVSGIARGGAGVEGGDNNGRREGDAGARK